MEISKHLRPISFLAIIILMLSQHELQAKTTVNNIDDLKALQTKVAAVSKKTMPATISLFSTKNGASGSGVIVSENGLILTAAHVVRGVTEMTVIFPDGKQTQAKVLGANYTNDSAMVQIINQNKKWPYAEIGHSKNLQVSDLVIALGHAGGYDAVRTPPVRFGRLIARGRNQFMTTDCTLIGGDSGGPLFDLEGRVIGIHSSIGESLSTNNHASIEGFRKDWNRLKEGETWGRFGGSSLDDPNAPILGVFLGNRIRGGGIRITDVVQGGPAANSGIQAGDILLSINDKPISNMRTLFTELANYKPGKVVLARILRGERKITSRVKLGRRGDLRE